MIILPEPHLTERIYLEHEIIVPSAKYVLCETCGSTSKGCCDFTYLVEELLGSPIICAIRLSVSALVLYCR